MMYEAVSPNILGGLAQTPVATCKTPTTWLPLPTPQNPTANPNVTLVGGVNLNDPGIETQADIETQLLVYPSPSSSTAVSIGTGYVCYTPLGHTYVTSGAGATPLFDGVLPTISPIEARVTRAQGGTIRSVLVPPNGMARLLSHT